MRKGTRKLFAERMTRKKPVKSPKEARDALAETWQNVRDSIKHLGDAGSLIGKDTKWAPVLAKLHKNLHSSLLRIEEMVDEMRTDEQIQAQSNQSHLSPCCGKPMLRDEIRPRLWRCSCGMSHKN